MRTAAAPAAAVDEEAADDGAWPPAALSFYTYAAAASIACRVRPPPRGLDSHLAAAAVVFSGEMTAPPGRDRAHEQQRGAELQRKVPQYPSPSYKPPYKPPHNKKLQDS